jgi:ubiquinone/menaquinone biosynthesis C-methylase UbiE
MTGGKPGWFLDESSCAGRENLDPAHVERYDTKEDASAANEVALLQSLGLARDSLMVEFGAGTGQFTVEVAPACAQVIAVDVSEPMLTRLRSTVADLGLSNVEVIRAGFLTYEHAGRPADFIYSRYALHHLSDFWKALALIRLRRMLRAGGVLRLWDVVYDFDPAEAEARIEAWCATGGDTVAAEWSRAEVEEHVRDEHSTFTWLLEPMIERSGFEVAHAEHSDDGIFATYLLRAA